MADNSFMHIGITVNDIDKMCDFYVKFFGAKKNRTNRFDENFIGGSPTLYRQPAGTYSDMTMLELDCGIVLELFQFSNVQQSPPYEWPMTGYHHLAFKVESIPDIYERMLADGIEFFFPPKQRGPNPGVHWIFFKDPDGNMIELWD